MKEKVKKGWLVACACACAGLLFAGSALLLPRSENALAAELPEAKVYYYVDCGNYVQNRDGTGDLYWRQEAGPGYPSTQANAWMNAHNLTFGSAENQGAGANVLYNSVTDKPFGTDGKGGEADATDGTGKKWGFIGSNNQWNYGKTRKDGHEENSDQAGFNTTRFHSVKDKGTVPFFQYKFEVDNDQDTLAIVLGTRRLDEWGGEDNTEIQINNGPKSNINSKMDQDLTYFYTAKGEKESDGKSYITITMGKESATEEWNYEAHVAWILIATGTHETVKTYPGKPATTTLGYAQKGSDKVYFSHYAVEDEEITLTSEQQQTVNAAKAFDEVTLDLKTFEDSEAKPYQFLVIPQDTVYFLNAGDKGDAGIADPIETYTQEKGAGREEENAALGGETYWGGSRFDQSVIGGAKGTPNETQGQAIKFKFDLEKGDYAVVIGACGHWRQTRVMEVKIDETKIGEVSSIGKPEPDDDDIASNATFYTSVAQAEGKQTINLEIAPRLDQDQGYMITYVLIYKVNRITYDEQGGSEVEDDYFEIGTTFTLNTAEKTTTRSHCTFDKWVTEPNGETKPEATYDHSITLYAKWNAAPYDVTCSVPESLSSEITDITDQKISVTVGQEVPTLPTTSATKTGYRLGWFTAEEGGVEVKQGETWEHDDVETIYARWVAKEYIIKFNDTVGTAPSDLTGQAYGSEVSLPDPTNIPEGKSFTGWFHEDEKIDTSEKLWNLVTGDETEIQLTAQYETAKYDVTFNLGGGTDTDNAAATQNIEHGQYATKPAKDPTKANYDFVGWYTAEEGGEEFNFGSVEIKQATTVYARWKATEYTITFSGDGVSETAVKYTVESANVTLPTPQREGYDFVEWQRDNVKFEYAQGTTVGDITLTAKWTLHQYTITFAGDGVSETAVKYTIETGATDLHLPTPTRTGYTFVEWQQNNAKFEYVKGTTKGDITLTAKWTAKTYSFTWNAGTDGTSTTGPASAAFDGSVTLPTVTANAGKKFEGWYIGETKIENAQAIWTYVAAHENETTVTFTAKYSELKYTVHFNSHEGSTVADKTNVEYNTMITAPADPTREGYTFDGWYKDAACTQKFDFENDKITEETTLHAKWTAVSTETPGDSGSTDNGTTDNNAGNTDNGSSDKTEEKNGCGSAIAAPVAMIASAVLMVGVALVIRKKHSEN